jgi:hypothetical protein
VISSCSLLPQLVADRYPTVVVHMGDEEEMQLVRGYSIILNPESGVFPKRTFRFRSLTSIMSFTSVN